MGKHLSYDLSAVKARSYFIEKSYEQSSSLAAYFIFISRRKLNKNVLDVEFHSKNMNRQKFNTALALYNLYNTFNIELLYYADSRILLRHVLHSMGSYSAPHGNYYQQKLL